MNLSTCPICRGALWLCEDHPAEPWPHEGCNAEGRACVCNPQSGVAWTDVDAEVSTDETMQ